MISNLLIFKHSFHVVNHNWKFTHPKAFCNNPPDQFLQSGGLYESHACTRMRFNPQHQGHVSQTFQLDAEWTLSICSIHLSASRPCQLRSVQQWCYCCWASAPAGLAGLSLAGRGRHRAEPASTGPAAEGGPSLMSLGAPHTEPAGMIYCAWSVVWWQRWRSKEQDRDDSAQLIYGETLRYPEYSH